MAFTSCLGKMLQVQATVAVGDTEHPEIHFKAIVLVL